MSPLPSLSFIKALAQLIVFAAFLLIAGCNQTVKAPGLSSAPAQNAAAPASNMQERMMEEEKMRRGIANANRSKQ